ncbi:peptidase [Hymenobacter sp. RP-2-7]|uniref:Peptidase n=1 Tax=Hymenobacter polaris TaxID=2682546 RepID=A0A7Y0AFB5_9BACT|nr:S41 family peptidase [Hymenobacter polaris]NML66325.1 peptidase [Hymenobacter polaris]
MKSVYWVLWVLWVQVVPLVALGQPRPALTATQYQQDFRYFWETVRDNYAYFDKKQTDWEQVRQAGEAALPAVKTRGQFVRLLENVLAELYDNHAALNTNLPDSRRLVPSGTDAWAQFSGRRAVVQAVRPGFGAAQAGLRPGMELLAVNDVPIEAATQALLGKHLKTVDAAAREVALNHALAGDHRTPRKWTVRTQGRRQDIFPDQNGLGLESDGNPKLLEARHYGAIGYVKINNSLGNNRLISVFDSALTTLGHPAGLVLDLRDTPNGGNTTVARALMGRFITQEQPYQRHELPAEEASFGVKRSWVELVSPRPAPYTGPLVVLVGRWTASMGEGITIGLDAMRRATVMGTEMAQLNGSIASYQLPQSGIGFSIPTERLYRVDGLPREAYLPPVYVQPATDTTDAPLQAALAQLRKAAPKP